MVPAVVLAVALAMDATAVAAARAAGGASRRDLVILAVAFGAAQGGMAALGWAGGAAAARWTAAWAHWLAAGVLAAIGVKMIAEAMRAGEGDELRAIDARVVVLLAIATSLDALAAGVTLPVLGAPPAVAVALIAGVTAALSLLGGLAGRAAGARLGRPLEVVGGVALIGIGVKILVEHL